MPTVTVGRQGVLLRTPLSSISDGSYMERSHVPGLDIQRVHDLDEVQVKSGIALWGAHSVTSDWLWACGPFVRPYGPCYPSTTLRITLLVSVWM